MHPGLGDDDEFAARFVREARAAARLSHPNVVAVYDQGDDDGTVFLAMEMVPGHTLRDVIRKESPMTPAAGAGRSSSRCSRRSRAAHRAGLIHRDIKPENVLIADDGRVKVADFGLAKAVSADTQHTATGGVLIGTVSYLAPELVVDGRADARADVYAIGVVLYELLTGSKPHEGESPIQVAYKHVHEDVPPPSAKVARHPAVRRRAGRAGHRPRPRPAAGRRGGAAPPGAPGQPGAGGRRPRGRRARGRPGPASPVAVEPTGDTAARPVRRPTSSPTLLAASDGGRCRRPTDAGTEHTTRDWTPPRAERGRSTRRCLTREPELPPSAAGRDGPGAARSCSLLALLLVVGAGLGAWWFGWARYTSTPGVIGLAQAAAVEKLEDAGPGGRGRRPGVLRDGARRARCSRPIPGAGERVLDGGTVTVVLSLGKERYDVPKLRGKSEDQAQDALAERQPGVRRVDRAVLRERAPRATSSAATRQAAPR